MKRSLLIAVAVAALGIGLVSQANAQIRFRIGGIQLQRGQSHSRNSYNNHRYQPVKRYQTHSNHHETVKYHHNEHDALFRDDEPRQQPATLEQPPMPWDNAEHVVRLDHSQFQGAYYEKNGKAYYATEEGQTQLVSHGGFSQVEDLAARLEMMTNELCLDLHHNYRHNTGFRYTYRDVYDVYQLAKYINSLQKEGSQEEIARRLDGLDRLFHFVRDDVRSWERQHFRRVGDLDANAKIERIEAAIHHLMNDVGVKLAANPVEPPAPENLVDLPPLPEEEG